MSAMIPFTFENKPIRIVPDAAGEPWFVAPDVCRVLEMANVTMALRILDEDEKGLNSIETLGGRQDLNCISEPGLYKLMARSRKPEARRFDRWVRHEVLPSIRKTGGYGTPTRDPMELLTDPAAMRGLLLGYTEKVIELQAEVALMAPKVESFERLAESEGSMCITDAAKTLQIPPRHLFRYLRANAWIYTRAGGTAEIAYQDKISSGVLEHKTTTVHRTDGTEKTVTQVRVTPKGLAKLALALRVNELALSEPTHH